MYKDPVIQKLIRAEERRQKNTINLIASENYAPDRIKSVLASTLINKYAEGVPGKRYYAGCAVVDEIEQCAIDRCMKLFDAEHANVQPHSGSQANMALYAALLKPGDCIMGMDLAAGGHLTHGQAINFSGVYYKTVSYGVDPKNELIDYEKLAELAREYKPKLIMAGASAYARVIDFARVKEIADAVGAFFVADIAHYAGLIAAQLYPSPVPHADIVSGTTHKTLLGPRGGFVLSKKIYQDKIDRAVFPLLQGGPFMHAVAAKAIAFGYAGTDEFIAYQNQAVRNGQSMVRAFIEREYRIVSGGTDTHLFVVDLRTKGLPGVEAEQALERAGILTSRSCIPYDPQKPRITSGLRIGTLAVTRRGMREEQVREIVDLIDRVVKNPEDKRVFMGVRTEVMRLCRLFPIPEI